MFFDLVNLFFGQFSVNLSDECLARFLTRFFARFLTIFLARVLTRVLGRGKNRKYSVQYYPALRKTLKTMSNNTKHLKL